MVDMNNAFKQKGVVREVKGTVTASVNSGLGLVVNLCSVSGKWDMPMQKTLEKRWMKTKEKFRGWQADRMTFKAGKIDSVAVQSDVWVVNMLALDEDNKLDPEAFVGCMKELLKLAKSEKASVHISNEEADFHDEPLSKVYGEPLSNNGTQVFIYKAK